MVVEEGVVTGDSRCDLARGVPLSGFAGLDCICDADFQELSWALILAWMSAMKAVSRNWWISWQTSALIAAEMVASRWWMVVDWLWSWDSRSSRQMAMADRLGFLVERREGGVVGGWVGAVEAGGSGGGET